MDAADQYLDSFTHNTSDREYRSIRCKYKAQDTHTEIKMKHVYIYKLGHEDNPTTKEDFFIGLTNSIHNNSQLHRFNARCYLLNNEGTNLNTYIQQQGCWYYSKYTILQETLVFNLDDELNLIKRNGLMIYSLFFNMTKIKRTKREMDGRTEGKDTCTS